MREDIAARARDRGGVVLAADLGARPLRAAARAGLVRVQPRAYVAATQPIDVPALVTAMAASLGGDAAVLGTAALWLHGAGPEPSVVEVGVRHGTTLRLLPPAHVRRVSADVLSATRIRRGVPVVDLEMAVVQASAKQLHRRVVELLEPLLRERRTTVVRLRARCRRGLDGSAAVRRAIDELAGGSVDAAVRKLRKALEVRGVTGLRTEVRFVSARGASCYGDLLHEASATLVEVDGYLTHTLRTRFRADRRRDRWMRRDHAVTTIRVDAAEVWDDVDALADELAALLAPRPPSTDAG